MRAEALVVDERAKVELPFLAQLEGMGWEHIEGDRQVADFTFRSSFRQVLLLPRLRRLIRSINVDESGEPWLDDARIDAAVNTLERLGGPGGLVAVNQATMELLVEGTTVEGDDRTQGRDAVVMFIDFDHPERNDFLAVNQFRVDPPGQRPSIYPDVVLFVNGIPLVVAEAKSPSIAEPMDEAITQLLRYSNQREVGVDEGVDRLFYYNALMVATSFYQARAAGVGASYEHYLAWKDTAPVPPADVRAALGVDTLSEQQLLVAGMLRPAHLLALVRDYTVFDATGGHLVKKVARYQQFRAVEWAVERLRRAPVTTPGRRDDGRGGVVWHTQGSGKSLTMVFLVKRMRSDRGLRRFKVVVVTDRKDLEKQLGETARLANEPVERARDRGDLIAKLSTPGSGLVMALLQKYVTTDEVPPADEIEANFRAFPVCNESEEIVVLVDEAHRGHAGMLHANLIAALPKAARIAFTGTPILLGERAKTHEIFGDFIDRYTIKTSEEDGSTVPILYEGRELKGAVVDGAGMDIALREAYPDATEEELEATRAKYVTAGKVLEAPASIEAKADDMLCHYVDTVLPGRFKAQIVANSRAAAVRYQAALRAARDRLVGELEGEAVALAAVPEDQLAEMQGGEGFRGRAFRQLDVIRRLDFAAVISHSHNQEPWLDEWSDSRKIDARITRFKKPLVHDEPDKADALAFLCVKSMLLTGFDAPLEQVLYVDRPLQGVELLQAIARVNRTAEGKEHGLVVDYYGLGDRLAAALSAYAAEDVEGTIATIADELPKLEDRHRRVLAVFGDARIRDIRDVDACVFALEDTRLRALFSVRLREFLASLDTVMPRREAVRFMGDAKLLGLINKAASNLYRDKQLAILGAGRKVQKLIDAHLEAEGINIRVEPVSILDPRFDEVVRAKTSDRAKASEMEHAARHHITVHLEEDPARYRKLSERLQGILDRFGQQWDQLAQQLELFVHQLREEETEPDVLGIDPRVEAPFYRLVVEANGGAAPANAIESVRALVQLIRSEVSAVDFWRNGVAQQALRGHVVAYLDDQDLVPYDAIDQVANDVMGIARANHARLVA